jgi:serine/threonine-protein kinase
MALTVDELRQAALLIEQALELPEDERRSWIAGQRDVSAQVREHLIAALARAEDDRLPTLAGLGGNDLDDDEAQAGDEVGGYRLLSRIGRGGMGDVWLAERSDGLLRRQVALKLPHSSLSRRQLAERFAREREILSALAHPNIARLYDAGISSDGRPYMALEYVQGQTLLEYCQAHGLDLNRRLKLFLQILAAVSHAHVHLVVHRDLKPGNVLVSADGHVHLLDFGIAKLLVDGRSPASEQTQFGGRAMTPRYAAPEQVLGQAVATTTDTYALGVMLYEMVAGKLPYALKRDTQSDLEQAILDAEPTLASAAAQTVQPWADRLKGDLDTILLKALKKDPGQRYATAAAFADDIRRYLRGEPVQARADSTWYRAGKFIRRHRFAVAVSTAAVLALTAALGFAIRQARLAQEEAAAATAVSDFMQGILVVNSAQQGDPQRARNTTARELLDAAAARFDEMLDEAPRAKADLARLLSMTYSQLDMPDRAAYYSERWVDLAERVHGDDALPVVDALLVSSLTLRAMRIDHPAQRSLLLRALAIAKRGGNRATLGTTWSVLAEFEADHDFAQAQDMARRSLDLARTSSEGQSVLLRAAAISVAAGDMDSGWRLADEGIRFAGTFKPEALSGDGSYILMPALLELRALAAWARKDLAAAEADLREAVALAARLFGESDFETLGLTARLSGFLAASGRKDEAGLLIDGVEAGVDTGAADDQRKFRYLALVRLGTAQRELGRHDAAARNLHRALAMRDGIEASPAVAAVWRELARSALGRGDRRQAGSALARATAMREKAGLVAPAILADEADIAAGVAAMPAQLRQATRSGGG